MKFIKLGCRTQGFPFGAVVEIGSKKGQIAEDIAKQLIEEGNATVYVEPIAGNGDEEIQKLQDKIKELEDGQASKDEEIQKLQGFVEEAIGLAKGTPPAGWEEFKGE